jgi:glutamyl-tRNA synthetase
MRDVSAAVGGVVGRFAPSPTGTLHLGNLRTALVAWLSARSQGGRFLIRFEDLDTVTSSRDHEDRQLADLAEFGLDWDGEVVRQSERFHLYDDAIQVLSSMERVYECFCTRREIREAISAPHADAPDGAYPGTCRSLAPAERADRILGGRAPAWRLRTSGERFEFDDRCAGRYSGGVDDVVLRRNDGVPAYNLAVVVDDHAQGVTEVVRGDDLLTSTPRQMLLGQLLGYAAPRYAHVPLVMSLNGERLAKRHGAVTLGELADAGLGPRKVCGLLAVSLGLTIDAAPVRPADLVERYSTALLSRQPWTCDPAALIASGGAQRSD